MILGGGFKETSTMWIISFDNLALIHRNSASRGKACGLLYALLYMSHGLLFHRTSNHYWNRTTIYFHSTHARSELGSGKVAMMNGIIQAPELNTG
mmetsp:Transcript_3398/g.6203  ORF Transcript_3398/g.6203 Transcript_3398/m.6203 type:complete len:95 (+) Transcript_3398:127-411(+)